MVVIEDTVYVNGWRYEIDRSIPKIKEELGEGVLDLDTKIKVGVVSSITEDYVKGILKIEVSSEKEIKEITVNGKQIEIPEKIEGKYLIEEEITKNGMYSIVAKDVNDKVNIGSTKVSEISEDMDIYNAGDLVKFRENVNKGATYEERTIRLMKDIDLSSICSEELGSWEPIGTYKNSEGNEVHFKGIFDGNYNKIKNLYINSSEYTSLGFFTEAEEKAYIKNTILENIFVLHSDSGNSSDYGHYTGGMIGTLREGCTIENCAVINTENEISSIEDAEIAKINCVRRNSWKFTWKCYRML